jgi:hypothetical protein
MIYAELVMERHPSGTPANLPVSWLSIIYIREQRLKRALIHEESPSRGIRRNPSA